MKKTTGKKSPENIFSARRADISAHYATVFSFSGSDPVSFGVCVCSRA